MKKITFTILTLIAGITSVFAQMPTPAWVTLASGQSNERVNSLATDASGNVLATGEYGAFSAVFGTYTLNLTGGTNDCFISKTDPAGTVLWVQKIGSSSNDLGTSITSDATGNLYATGFYGASCVAGTISLPGSGMFLVKYSPTGTVAWAKKVNGGTGSGYGYGVGCDISGNVYVTGTYAGTIIVGTTTLTTGNSSTNVFIAKYDALGNVLWVKDFGDNTMTDRPDDLTIDNSGNVLVSGTYQGTMTVGTTTMVSNGFEDVFVVKYDNLGNPLWAKSAGGTNIEGVTNVGVDLTGNVFVSSEFNSASINFGTTNVANTNTVSAGKDVFVVKYNSSGVDQWSTVLGGSQSSEFGPGMNVDPSGNVYLTGLWNSSTMAIGATTYTNSFNGDLYVVRYNSAGNVTWSGTAGANKISQGNAITTDLSGNMILAGQFVSATYTLGMTTFTNASTLNKADAYIAKFSVAGLGLNELENKFGFSVYPNPSNGVFTLQLKEEVNGGELIVTDVIGKEILKQEIKNGTQQIELNINTKGLYFVRLESDPEKNGAGGKRMVKKIVVQ
ncbi:MAG: SBBP repeat-containing protein [Bacteroidia bacterium]|nr:SBBP repeat-containing protein [Bacteroidia bacterium]